MKDVPIWEKSNLTLEEAAAYSGIGINKLREITCVKLQMKINANSSFGWETSV